MSGKEVEIIIKTKDIKCVISVNFVLFRDSHHQMFLTKQAGAAMISQLSCQLLNESLTILIIN